MNQKLQEFLERASQEKKKKEQTQREEHLISLGLVDEEREYNKVRTGKYRYWDNEKKMYFCDRQKPIEVTDEEYELICKYAPYEESSMQKTSNSNTKKYGMMPSGNGAENFLGVAITIACVLGGVVVLVSAILELYALSQLDLPADSGMGSGGVFVTLLTLVIALIAIAIFYCFVRVFLNMSNNLHNINARVSQIASKNK